MSRYIFQAFAIWISSFIGWKYRKVYNLYVSVSFNDIRADEVQVFNPLFQTSILDSSHFLFEIEIMFDNRHCTARHFASFNLQELQCKLHHIYNVTMVTQTSLQLSHSGHNYSDVTRHDLQPPRCHRLAEHWAPQWQPLNRMAICLIVHLWRRQRFQATPRSNVDHGEGSRDGSCRTWENIDFFRLLRGTHILFSFLNYLRKSMTVTGLTWILNRYTRCGVLFLCH